MIYLETEAKNSRHEARRNVMLNDSIPKLIPKMAIPTMISMVVMSLYNMADTFSSVLWGKPPQALWELTLP